ncbi:putative BAH domain, Agenet-like domain, Agenet domain, plant type [Helianthus annuus]|nr:putative BAH domain, Agenet-like domain, Agenet domain, plant type [Helianthus annuus]KAJ0723245.1 putative BAH domain, Agenet-like domain, Agenet domain, plant type [Helianthus annuus]
MAASNQCYVEWKEHYVSKERGKRVVHYFLKDISGESVLAVVGTERSVRHMLYVVAEDFLKVNEAENSVNAGYRWRSRREVVNWLTSMLSKQHRQAPKSDHISRFGASYQNRLARNIKLRVPDIVWSGVAWTCSKQLKHFPAFCRNGITIAVQSFVYVMSEEEIRHLAYLEDMYEDRKGQKKVKVRWFHHSKEVQAAITLKNSHPREVFITPYAQVISVECVDGPALVLAREHYDKCVSTLPEDLLTRVHLCLRQFKNNRVKPFKLSKLCGYFDQPVFLVLDSDFLEDEDNSGGDVVKVGAKRPRSARGRQVAPCDSSCMDVKYEILRRKLIPTYVKNRDANVLSFKINEKIELLSLDSGIRGCWFRCTIMQVTRRQLKVQYDDLKDEDGSGNLEEWVPTSRSAMPDKLGIRCLGRPTARPARIEEEADFAIEVGSPVDGWWSDGWWEGVVTGIGESGAGVVKVYVPGENLFLDIDIKNIRVSRDWVGDHWVDLETKPNILSLIPANNNEIKPECSPVSSKETPKPVDPEPVGPEHVDPKPVDPEHVDPEPIGPEHVDPEPNGPGPVDPEPIGPEPVDPEHVNDFNDHELHEKEKDPSSALDDNLQIAEQGEHASEKMEA